MSYYKNFASYEDGIVGAKGFYVKVVDMDGKEYISSAIPIDHIDLVLLEGEQAIMETTNWSIWNGTDKKVVVFAGGTIRRIEAILL